MTSWTTTAITLGLLGLLTAALPAEAQTSGNLAPRARKAGIAMTGDEMVKAVQQALKEKGHDPGSVDGRMGPKTQRAIRDYQAAHGLEATGQLARSAPSCPSASNRRPDQQRRRIGVGGQRVSEDRPRLEVAVHALVAVGHRRHREALDESRRRARSIESTRRTPAASSRTVSPSQPVSPSRRSRARSRTGAPRRACRRPALRSSRGRTAPASRSETAGTCASPRNFHFSSSSDLADVLDERAVDARPQLALEVLAVDVVGLRGDAQRECRPRAQPRSPASAPSPRQASEEREIAAWPLPVADGISSTGSPWYTVARQLSVEPRERLALAVADRHQRASAETPRTCGQSRRVETAVQRVDERRPRRRPSRKAG